MPPGTWRCCILFFYFFFLFFPLVDMYFFFFRSCLLERSATYYGCCWPFPFAVRNPDLHMGSFHSITESINDPRNFMPVERSVSVSCSAWVDNKLIS
jgi:hypothetical protein